MTVAKFQLKTAMELTLEGFQYCKLPAERLPELKKIANETKIVEPEGFFSGLSRVCAVLIFDKWMS